MVNQSVRPCGCDPSAGWTCDNHRFINSVILETVAQLEASEHPTVVVCGWCPDHVEKTQAALDTGAMVSHTICPECALKLENG
jgi:hypothetical protein